MIVSLQPNCQPKAFVVLKPGRMRPADFSCTSSQPLRTITGRIEFVPDLPKTATGKIQRFKLRGLAKSG